MSHSRSNYGLDTRKVPRCSEPGCEVMLWAVAARKSGFCSAHDKDRCGVLTEQGRACTNPTPKGGKCWKHSDDYTSRRKAARPTGVSTNDRILAALRDYGPLGCEEISERAKTTTNVVARIVRRLEKQGLVLIENRKRTSHHWLITAKKVT